MGYNHTEVNTLHPQPFSNRCDVCVHRRLFVFWPQPRLSFPIRSPITSPKKRSRFHVMGQQLHRPCFFLILTSFWQPSIDSVIMFWFVGFKNFDLSFNFVFYLCDPFIVIWSVCVNILLMCVQSRRISREKLMILKSLMLLVGGTYLISYF